MSEKALSGMYEQTVVALIERRQKITEEANRQIRAVNEALAQVTRDAARSAGLDEGRARLANAADGSLVLREVEDDQAERGAADGGAAAADRAGVRAGL